MQDLAARAGAAVGSVEVLPSDAAGAYRRISLRVTATGAWPVVVGLFRSLEEATPRVLVDDVSLRPSLALGAAESHPLEAGFTVIGFRASPAP